MAPRPPEPLLTASLRDQYHGERPALVPPWLLFHAIANRQIQFGYGRIWFIRLRP